MSFWVKTNRIVKWIFPNYVWDIPNNEKKVFLTFDDGPTPEITEWVLNALKKYNAEATFFCIGNNIEKHPQIFQKVIDAGHSIGNHTFNHLKGWETKNNIYIENAALCNLQIEEGRRQKAEKNESRKSASCVLNSKLFRPPYGKIKPSQSRILRKQGYKIIMWDIISFDFDQELSKEKCLDNVLNNARPGSVIVFHDSLKAEKNLKYALPKTLEFLNKQGYIFAKISL